MYNNLTELSATLSDMTSILSQPSVGILFSRQMPASSVDKIVDTVLARLTVREAGDASLSLWCLPEGFQLDASRDTLPSRPPHPLLVVNVLSPHNSGNKARGYLAAALELGVNIHQNTLDILPTKNSVTGRDESLYKVLGLPKMEWFVLTVPGSGREHVLPGFSSAAVSCSGDQPCCILCPRRTKDGNDELVLLPYNFPQLFHLLKLGVSGLKSFHLANPSASSVSVDQSHQSLQKLLSNQSWVSSWRIEFNTYLAHIPPQYCQQVLLLSKKCGLVSLINIAKIPEVKLSNKILKIIQHFQENAVRDVASMEDIAMDKRPREDHTPVGMMNIASSADVSCGQLASWEIPSSLHLIREDNLMSMWERQRRSVFGGGEGLACRGLSMPDVHSCGGTSMSNFYSPAIRGFQSNWLVHAGGACSVSNRSSRVMSNYMDVLARRESLRDVATEDPIAIADENSAKERLKRFVSFYFTICIPFNVLLFQ